MYVISIVAGLLVGSLTNLVCLCGYGYL